MKVLLSSSTINRKNGYGNITYELSRTLVEKGVEVTLLLPEDCSVEASHVSGLKIEKVLPPYLFRYNHPALLKYLTWSYKTDEKFDLVHSLFEIPYAPLMARESKRMGVPFVVGAQGTYGVKPLHDFPEKYFLKYAYRSAQAIHVPSAYTKQEILKSAGEHYDISIIHNGVDFERFNAVEAISDEFRKRFTGRKVLLTVGELKSRKGQDIVIRALKFVVKKHPEVLYVIVGKDGWKGYLERLVSELNLEQHVLFPGIVSDEDIVKYFAVCDLYVHTPRITAKYYFEGFGIVYLEAAALGKPAVATDAGGIRDAVIDGQTGYVAKDENVEEVAAYIHQLLADEGKRNKFGNSAKEYALRHSWSCIADQYIALYNKVLIK